jgi:hypothetical protein
VTGDDERDDERVDVDDGDDDDDDDDETSRIECGSASSFRVNSRVADEEEGVCTTGGRANDGVVFDW